VNQELQERIADWISDNFVWIVLAIPVACVLFIATTLLTA
jgi:signal transduction histidine kinase